MSMWLNMNKIIYYKFRKTTFLKTNTFLSHLRLYGNAILGNTKMAEYTPYQYSIPNISSV